MDIRQLEYFIAVADRGNFTKAADDLFISRQALSKAVKNLEHELGLTLLESSANHLKPTEAGHAFYSDTAPLVKAFKEVEDTYLGSTAKTLHRNQLSVAMAHGTALSLPERTINIFHAEYPDILLSVEEVTTDAAIEMARTAEVDVSIVGSAPPYLSEFDVRLVVETGVFLFVPHDNPLAQKEKLSLSDLDKQPFVTFGKRNHLHRYFMEACAGAGVHPNILLTTSNTDLLVRSAQKQGALYFGFPPTVVPSESTDHSLLRLDMGFSTDFGTYIIKRKGIELSSAAYAFWNFLEQLEPHFFRTIFQYPFP